MTDYLRMSLSQSEERLTRSYCLSISQSGDSGSEMQTAALIHTLYFIITLPVSQGVFHRVNL